jgi:hypothetical protein
MSKEQLELLGEAYENYSKKSESQFIPNFEDGTMTIISPASHYNFLSQEKFINKCKTDQEFSEKWGLTIKERELSLEERKKLMKEDTEFYCRNDAEIELYLAIENIPTKLITITYNDKTIESYETNSQI